MYHDVGIWAYLQCGRMEYEFGARIRGPVENNICQLSERGFWGDCKDLGEGRDLGMGIDMWASGGEMGEGTAREGRVGRVGVSEWRPVSVRRGLGAHKGRPYRGAQCKGGRGRARNPGSMQFNARPLRGNAF